MKILRYALLTEIVLGLILIAALIFTAFIEGEGLIIIAVGLVLPELFIVVSVTAGVGNFIQKIYSAEINYKNILFLILTVAMTATFYYVAGKSFIIIFAKEVIRMSLQ